MKSMRILSLLLIIFAVTSCTVKKASDNASESAYAKLTNNTWVLTDNNESLKNYSGQDITLMINLNENTISGFSGCNQYFTNNFTLDENGNLTIGMINATKKYCPDNKIEKTYLDMLKNVTRYEVDNSELSLYKEDLLLLTYSMLLE